MFFYKTYVRHPIYPTQHETVLDRRKSTILLATSRNSHRPLVSVCLVLLRHGIQTIGDLDRMLEPPCPGTIAREAIWFNTGQAHLFTDEENESLARENIGSRCLGSIPPGKENVERIIGPAKTATGIVGLKDEGTANVAAGTNSGKGMAGEELARTGKRRRLTGIQVRSPAGLR